MPAISDCQYRIGYLKDHKLMAEAVGLVYGLHPRDLVVRIVERRENKAWNPLAVSDSGAVGLAQIKPGTVCRYTPGCVREDKARLGRIEQWLKHPAYNLCWGGRILAELARACGAGGWGCAVASYYWGEFGARYAADVLGA